MSLAEAFKRKVGRLKSERAKDSSASPAKGSFKGPKQRALPSSKMSLKRSSEVDVPEGGKVGQY